MPDHENDTWPYLIGDHNLYAVPVSSYNLSDELVLLPMASLRRKKSLSAVDGFDLLISKFDETAGMAILWLWYSTTSSQAMTQNSSTQYKKFIDYATSKNAHLLLQWI